MKILRQSTTDKATNYLLARSDNVEKMSDHVDETFTVADFLEYEESDSNGEIHQLLSIKTGDGAMFATNSPTFVREFDAICEIFGENDLPELKIVSGRAQRSGRQYVTVTLASDK